MLFVNPKENVFVRTFCVQVFVLSVGCVYLYQCVHIYITMRGHLLGVRNS